VAPPRDAADRRLHGATCPCRGQSQNSFASGFLLDQEQTGPAALAGADWNEAMYVIRLDLQQFRAVRNASD
jgi:hypothetical protein